MIDNFNRYVLANAAVLLHGLSVTMEVCVLAFALAVVLGAVACLVRLYVPLLRGVAVGYIEFCRATPIVVQLMWVNYVWPEVFGFPRTMESAGVIALALQSSGYLAETFRAGIEGLPRGQWEAGLAVGMRHGRHHAADRDAAGAAGHGAGRRCAATGRNGPWATGRGGLGGDRAPGRPAGT